MKAFLWRYCTNFQLNKPAIAPSQRTMIHRCFQFSIKNNLLLSMNLWMRFLVFCGIRVWVYWIIASLLSAATDPRIKAFSWDSCNHEQSKDTVKKNLHWPQLLQLAPPTGRLLHIKGHSWLIPSNMEDIGRRQRRRRRRKRRSEPQCIPSDQHQVLPWWVLHTPLLALSIWWACWQMHSTQWPAKEKKDYTSLFTQNLFW